MMKLVEVGWGEKKKRLITAEREINKNYYRIYFILFYFLKKSSVCTCDDVDMK